MINNETKVSASFKEIGETLVSRGNYSVAKINVVNSFQKNEVFSLIEPSRTIKEPVYKSATRNVILSNSFIQNCLQRPQKPTKNASQKQWDLYLNWFKISDERKIEIQLEEYAHDLNYELITFQLI